MERTVVKRGNGRLLIVATSEGGPPVIHAILSQLTKDIPIAIVVCQISKGGAIDPVCNALNRTTQFNVKPLEGSMGLTWGSVCVIPYGFRAVIDDSVGAGDLAIGPASPKERKSKPFVQLLKSASRIFTSNLKVILVGGMGRSVEGLIPGLEAVCSGGGEIAFVKEPTIAAPPELEERARHTLAIDLLTVDELVAKLYAWCRLTGKARYPT
jgi:chemotaxis response regulator CheB